MIDLLNVGGWADTVVVEHRHGTAYLDQYAGMLRRWGHVTTGCPCSGAT